MKKLLKTTLLASAVSAATAFAVPASAEESILLPVLSYRTGPFAATGLPMMNGQRDYITMLNERDGGANGVKLEYVECETAYNTEKGLECYERMKAQGAVVTQPWSSGTLLQILPKASVDKIPILAPTYGFSAIQDGRTFPWIFNPPTSYWDGASILMQTIADGDLDNLKGKKIALLHLDAPYGKEPIPLLETYAQRHGFSLVTIPVGLKEMQNQSAQWLQIRRENPDFVLVWGFGAMNVTAFSEAVKTRFPMDRILGIFFSGHDGDLKDLGEAAKGYRAVSWSNPNSTSPLMQDVRKYVVDAGKSEINVENGEFEWLFYQRGLLLSLILVEGIKSAQAHFDTGVITSEQLRWGLENMKMDEAALEAIGAGDMIVPFETSCTNHTGQGGGWIIEWDGAKFVRVSDLLMPDRATIDPIAQANAKAYAESNAPWPVNADCKS